MNRTTAATLLAAAIVGLAGGTVSAVVRTDGQPGAQGPGTSGASPAPTATPVLYAGGKVIHDGNRAIRYDVPFDTPDDLVRTADGYLIAQKTSPQEPSLRLYAVSRTGQTQKVADVLGRFDLDQPGRRIVGTELESGHLTVWDLTGKVLATGPLIDGTTTPVWHGNEVVVTAPTAGLHPQWQVSTWDPQTGAVRRTSDAGMTEVSGSLTGALLGGAVGTDGVATDQVNPCLRVSSAPGTPTHDWQTCDWRPNAPAPSIFSPDGRTVMAIRSETDGFGPGSFGFFSATRGPGRGVTELDVPDWTLDAEWLDHDHVVVRSRTDGDLTAGTGTVLRRCSLDGKCAVVARRTHGLLVVGRQY